MITIMNVLVLLSLNVLGWGYCVCFVCLVQLCNFKIYHACALGTCYSSPTVCVCVCVCKALHSESQFYWFHLRQMHTRRTLHIHFPATWLWPWPLHLLLICAWAPTAFPPPHFCSFLWSSIVLPIHLSLSLALSGAVHRWRENCWYCYGC